MRLIASPHLSQADADAIAQGLKQWDEVITAVLLHELEQLDQLAHDRLGYLAWLLSKGRLEVKWQCSETRINAGFIMRS